MSFTKWKSENGFGESSDLFGVDFKREAVSDSEGSAIVDADFERAERLERCYEDPTMVKIREGLQMQVRELNTTWSLVLNVDEMWRAMFRHSEKRIVATTEQSERGAAVPVVVVRVQEQKRSVSNTDEPGVPQRCASYRAHASSGPEEWWGPWRGRRAAAEDDAACLEAFREAGAKNSDYDAWHNQINKRVARSTLDDGTKP